MTPGQEALAEAARIEQARIYSRLCREPKPEPRVHPARVQRLEERVKRQGPPVTDLDRERARRIGKAERTRIESAIARTGTVDGAVAETGVDRATVYSVWKAMSA